MQVLNIFHVLVAIALIAFVLIQRGQGATAGAAFGSGASGTVFGSRGAGNFLSRSTWVKGLSEESYPDRESLADAIVERVAPTSDRVRGPEQVDGLRPAVRTRTEPIAHTAMVSYRLWLELFGGEDEAIGRTIELDGISYDVVGVMPADFVFPFPRWRDRK